jgi:hypothetical protein
MRGEKTYNTEILGFGTPLKRKNTDLNKVF